MKGPLGPFTYTRCDDAAMHVFLDAMNRRDWVFTLSAIKPFFPHYHTCMCVVKLETCPMRATIAAIVASRAATRQCEQIIKTYKVLFLPLVAARRIALCVKEPHIIMYGRKKSGKAHLRCFIFIYSVEKYLTVACRLLRVIVNSLWLTWRGRILLKCGK